MSTTLKKQFSDIKYFNEIPLKYKKRVLEKFKNLEPYDEKAIDEKYKQTYPFATFTNVQDIMEHLAVFLNSYMLSFDEESVIYKKNGKPERKELHQFMDEFVMRNKEFLLEKTDNKMIFNF